MFRHIFLVFNYQLNSLCREFLNESLSGCINRIVDLHIMVLKLVFTVSLQVLKNKVVPVRGINMCKESGVWHHSFLTSGV